MEHKLRPFDRTLAAEGAPMMLGSDRLFALTYVAGPARCGNVMVTRPGGELALYQEDKLSMMPVVFIDNLPFYTGDSVYFNGAMKTLLGANPEYPHLLTMVGDLAYYEARQLTALPAPVSPEIEPVKHVKHIRIHRGDNLGNRLYDSPEEAATCCMFGAKPNFKIARIEWED